MIIDALSCPQGGNALVEQSLCTSASVGVKCRQQCATTKLRGDAVGARPDASGHAIARLIDSCAGNMRARAAEQGTYRTLAGRQRMSSNVAHDASPVDASSSAATCCLIASASSTMAPHVDALCVACCSLSFTELYGIDARLVFLDGVAEVHTLPCRPIRCIVAHRRSAYSYRAQLSPVGACESGGW